MPSWRQLLTGARGAVGSHTDARRMVESASGYDRAELLVALDRPAPPRAARALAAMVERRASGEPLQYVVASWGFRSLDLFVDSRVLIPRPETEMVVEVALAELARLSEREPLLAVDLGTGSGAIALALAAEVPRATRLEVWATDISCGALSVARANLAGLSGWAATRVRLAQGSWFAALPDRLRGRLGLVVANPPYVSEAEVTTLPTEVSDWEPREALVSGPTGLEALAHLVSQAPAWLNRPGTLVAELAPHQADTMVSAADQAGFSEVAVHPDLTGRPRALVGRI